MSFFNSEARACYINILAGTLGFAGAGATLAVSRLVTEGVYIAQVPLNYNTFKIMTYTIFLFILGKQHCC